MVVAVAFSTVAVIYAVPAVVPAVKKVVITPFTVVKEVAVSVPKVDDRTATAPFTGAPAAVTTSTRIVAVPSLFLIPPPP